MSKSNYNFDAIKNILSITYIEFLNSKRNSYQCANFSRTSLCYWLTFQWKDEVISGSSWAAETAMIENYSWMDGRFHNNEDCKQQIFEVWVLKVIASYKVYSLTFSKSAKKSEIHFMRWPFHSKKLFFIMDRYNISVNNRADWRVECSGVRSSLVVMGILFKVASSLACCERFSMGQARATQLWR